MQRPTRARAGGPSDSSISTVILGIRTLVLQLDPLCAALCAVCLLAACLPLRLD